MSPRAPFPSIALLAPSFTFNIYAAQGARRPVEPGQPAVPAALQQPARHREHSLPPRAPQLSSAFVLQGVQAPQQPPSYGFNDVFYLLDVGNVLGAAEGSK